jgi:hypothetical protein
VAAIILPVLGRWFDQQRFGEIFWLIAVTPMVGVLLWLGLSRSTAQSHTPALE